MPLVATSGIQLYLEESGAGDPLLLIMDIAARRGDRAAHREVRSQCVALDLFTSPWMPEEVASRIPGCDCPFYDNAGHAFHWEMLRDFTSRARTWLLGH